MGISLRLFELLELLDCTKEITGGRNALYDKEWVSWVHKNAEHLSHSDAIMIIKRFLGSLDGLEMQVRLFRITTCMKIIPLLLPRFLPEAEKFAIVVLHQCIVLVGQARTNNHLPQQKVFKECFHQILKVLEGYENGEKLIETARAIIEGCIAKLRPKQVPELKPSEQHSEYSEELDCIIIDQSTKTTPRVFDSDELEDRGCESEDAEDASSSGENSAAACDEDPTEKLIRDQIKSKIGQYCRTHVSEQTRQEQLSIYEEFLELF